jgi:hypothetical protein
MQELCLVRFFYVATRCAIGAKCLRGKELRFGNSAMLTHCSLRRSMNTPPQIGVVSHNRCAHGLCSRTIPDADKRHREYTLGRTVKNARLG